MSDYSRRVIIVVPAADQAAANLAAQAAVPNCGPDTFTAGLVSAGAAPGSAPTHLWCSWQVAPAQATALKNQFGQGNAHGWIMRPGVARDEPQLVEGERERSSGEVLTELGLERRRPVFVQVVSPN